MGPRTVFLLRRSGLRRREDAARSAAGRLPGFLCIGAQRGGTTTLQKLLERHPQVFLPQEKEVHYFSLHAEREVEWYAGHYREAAAGRLCGDITPYYLFHPAAPGRIRTLLPQVRLIMLLRDPVERALSQYFHAVELGLEDLPLAEALAAEASRLAGAEELLLRPGARHRSHQEHSYLSRSRYREQLGRYEALFSRHHMLLLRSEDLFGNPDHSWRRIQDFLGLRTIPLPVALPRANASRGAMTAVPPPIRQQLRRELLPTYDLMAGLYGMRWDDLRAASSR